jgi:hypothetical protein
MKIGKNQATIITIVTFFILLIVGSLVAYQYGLFSLQVDPTIAPQNVKTTNISSNQFTVSWITEIETQGLVQYGIAGNLGSVQIDDRDQPSGQPLTYRTHHVTITGLQPGTAYEFKLLTGEDGDINVDDGGTPFVARTAPQLSEQTQSDLINGTVQLESGEAAVGAIVYVKIQGVSPLSTQVKKDGSWLISLASAYSEDLTNYASYDPELEAIDLLIQGEDSVSKAITLTANKTPVPPIVMGQTYDFTEFDELADVSDGIGPEEIFELDSDAELPEIFLQDATGNTTEQVVILSPAFENEELYTNRPQFIGTGPAGTRLTINIISLTTVTGSSSVDANGDWQFVLNQDLAAGSYTLEVEYTIDGELQDVARDFVISGSTGATTGGSNIPAFESTPAATPVATPIPSPRVSVPSTSGGVPVSGTTTPTVIVLLLGLLLLGTGMYAKGALGDDR